MVDFIFYTARHTLGSSLIMRRAVGKLKRTCDYHCRGGILRTDMFKRLHLLLQPTRLQVAQTATLLCGTNWPSIIRVTLMGYTTISVHTILNFLHTTSSST
ncbi:hypothetical protein PFISCL1PPCAC_17927, partial [Pristionchus fissidentatus]